eukprot:3682358-Prymnesium_polylepis.1
MTARTRRVLAAGLDGEEVRRSLGRRQAQTLPKVGQALVCAPQGRHAARLLQERRRLQAEPRGGRLGR